MNGILLATPAHLATTMDAALRQNQTNPMTGAESYLRLEAAVRSRDRLAPEEESQMMPVCRSASKPRPLFHQ